MLDYYFIKKKVIQTDEKNFNWLVINNSDTEEIGRVVEKYQLPEDIFIGNSYPEEVSRLEYRSGTKLQHPTSLVLLNLSSKQEKIEKRLTPISFVLSDNLLIACVEKETDFLNI